jgi:hypothetical protein
VCQAGLVELSALTPGVTLLADAGYQGLSAQTGGVVLALRPARRANQLPVPPALAAAHEAERSVHSAQRIRVEHGIGHLTNWRALSRHPAIRRFARDGATTRLLLAYDRLSVRSTRHKRRHVVGLGPGRRLEVRLSARRAGHRRSPSA